MLLSTHVILQVPEFWPVMCFVLWPMRGKRKLLQYINLTKARYGITLVA